MTEGEERREYIIQLLTQTKKPISGTELAKQMKVSRQVIVQDIALLRASNRNILSTNKGYLYDRADEKKVVRRTFFVCHTDGRRTICHCRQWRPLKGRCSRA